MTLCDFSNHISISYISYLWNLNQELYLLFSPSEERVLNISDGKIDCACGTREDSSYDMLEVNFCQKREGDPVMRN